MNISTTQLVKEKITLFDFYIQSATRTKNWIWKIVDWCDNETIYENYQNVVETDEEYDKKIVFGYDIQRGFFDDKFPFEKPEGETTIIVYII